MQNQESNQIENLSETPVEKTVSFPANAPVTPDNPPWTSAAAFLVWFASVAFILILPNIFLIPYVLSLGVDFRDNAKLLDVLQNDPTAVLLNVLAVIPAHILTVALAWLVVTKSYKYSFRETLGWRWGGFNALYCVLILFGFFALAAVVNYYFPEQDNDLLRILRSSRTAVYVVAFLATFTAPLVEEVVYRGVLYSALQRSFSVPISVLLVTALFALVHVPQYYPSYATIFLICLLSLILTLIRVSTRNLLPCIVLHTVFNGVQSLLLILQPFLETKDASKPAFFSIF